MYRINVPEPNLSEKCPLAFAHGYIGSPLPCDFITSTNKLFEVDGKQIIVHESWLIKETQNDTN